MAVKPQYELRLNDHFTPNMWNLGWTREDHERLSIHLKKPIWQWLNQQRFPYSITIARYESAPELPTPGNHLTVDMRDWERSFRAFIEFDCPSHLLLFKLTWS
jgi:hypothetical protein